MSTSALQPVEEKVETLRDLTPHQWRSGIAAWLGWMFDGLDMHLYTLVALPFVAQLLGVLSTKDAGFCYSIGRVAAAFGTVFFGLFSKVGDHRFALLFSSLLFLPAALLSLRLPHVRD